MGLKSILGKVGKVALKVAPYAALAIPGVGIPASMAISAASNAASKKLEGGSWKSALGAGALGAGTALAGAKLPIGGSNKLPVGKATDLTKIGTKVASSGAPIKQSILGKVGEVAKKVGTKALNDQGISTSGSKTGTILGAAKNIASRLQNNAGPSAVATRASDGPYAVPRDQVGASNRTVDPQTGLMRGLGPVMGQRNQNFPNLAEAIGAGRQTAMRDQPFRQGYDVKVLTGYENDDKTKPIYSISHMPSMSGANMSRKRKPRTYEPVEASY